ncbi:DegT/DnrJ/EryC1/StrS aminotransferase family protein [Candidatus Saccharibacteria bacterium]|nr:DegT/DnrJ/EryC1/StrS aminotransferase family protein [Candidatus Saccharibacteria bacterium]
MFFLGQAANLRGKILKHTFSTGARKDYDELKKYLAGHYDVDLKNVFLYHNGRTALSAGLRAAVPKKNGEHPGVLITALTCYAVVEAVKSAGFTPVFADIDEKTLHFNGRTAESALKKHKNVRAIIVQNNLGYPCDIKSIKTVAKKHNLVLIEDLAHCAGISYDNKKEAGTLGDVVALSFGKGKSIDTISGGALVLRAKEITYVERGRFKTKEVKLPKEPGRKPKFSDRFRDRFYPLFGTLIRGFYHLKLGRLFTSFLLKTHQIKRSADADLDLKVRLTYWQAKLALEQLKSLPKDRPPLREFYFVEDREKVLKELEKNGFIMNEIWYDIPVSPERYYNKVRFPENECPVATEISKHLINLPTYYKRTELQPARKIIKKYQIGGKND